MNIDYTGNPKNREEILKWLKEHLSEERYIHTLGVEECAKELARMYGINPDKAAFAGLLHDCAKCMSNEKRLSICEKHNISVNKIERKNPFLLHAKVGSYIAMQKFHVHDSDTVNAILNHTTGRPDMSLLEKIIYVADYIEPGRK